jgi:dethiobiotin synthetase
VADLLVTGTDTGVGKTVVAAALVMALRQIGARAIGWKPVETGIAPDEIADSEVLAVASGSRLPLAAPLLRLPEPLAPAVAAERAGVTVEPAAFEERLRALRAAGHTVVVEGAGGALVPLAWGYTALDLAAREGLTAVVVARPGLGTLNHVALTLEALDRRGIPVLSVVLNGRGDPPDLAEATNPGALARLCPGVPISVLPRQATKTPLGVARACAPILLPLLAP